MNLFSDGALLSLFLGIGLAVSAGFRVFLPLFLLSLLTFITPDYIEISIAMLWINNPYVIALFGILMVVEIIVYYIPFLDNKLDKIKFPLAIIVGTILMKATLYDYESVLGWILSFILGGLIAGIVSFSVATARNITTVTTHGVGNFLINTGEIIGSLCLSITAIFISPLAFIIAVILVFIMLKALNKIEKRSIESFA